MKDSFSRSLGRGRALAAVLFVSSVAACAHAVTSRSPAAAVPQARRADPTNGVDILRAMHDRYASTWYKTLTFSQTTTITLPSGGTLVQQWLEAGKLPGRLRIDTDTASRGGVIYVSDSVFRFAAGKLAAATADVNELLVLGFDVYAQPVHRTADILTRRGIDLSKISRAMWEGRPVYVIGAIAGDTTSKQFWVDADRLLFVRLLETGKTSVGPRHFDYRFERYVPHAGGWLAEEVVGLRDGKPSLHEVYSNVRVDVPLDDATFDPAQWATVTPWYRQ
jgi:hypothetical protein